MDAIRLQLRDNLLVVELRLHHVRLLVRQSVSNVKLPAGGRADALHCAVYTVQYLVTILIHLDKHSIHYQCLNLSGWVSICEKNSPLLGNSVIVPARCQACDASNGSTTVRDIKHAVRTEGRTGGGELSIRSLRNYIPDELTCFSVL